MTIQSISRRGKMGYYSDESSVESTCCALGQNLNAALSLGPVSSNGSSVGETSTESPIPMDQNSELRNEGLFDIAMGEECEIDIKSDEGDKEYGECKIIFPRRFNRKKRGKSSSSSFGSIKDALSIGSIDENLESTDNISFTIDSDFEDEDNWSSDEASMGSSVISDIIKKVDSINRIAGQGRRLIQTATQNSTIIKGSILDDPLMKRFLQRKPATTRVANMKETDRNHAIKPTTTGCASGTRERGTKQVFPSLADGKKDGYGKKEGPDLIDTFLQRRLANSSKGGCKTVMDSILNSSDSLQRISGNGQRIVQSRVSSRRRHSTPQTNSFVSTMKGDALIDQYLQTRHNVSSKSTVRTIDSILRSADSLDNVTGRGQRVVGSIQRQNCPLTKV